MRPVKGEQLASEGVRVQTLDLATMAPSDQDFTAQFRLEPRAGAGAHASPGGCSLATALLSRLACMHAGRRLQC